jgi:small neutral amino acid transporter SnatA (MarC family)
MNTQKRYARKTFISAIVFILVTILFLWSWNTAITSVFGLSVLNFKQAAALLIFIGLTSLFINRGRHQHRDGKLFSSSHHQEDFEK